MQRPSFLSIENQLNQKLRTHSKKNVHHECTYDLQHISDVYSRTSYQETSSVESWFRRENDSPPVMVTTFSFQTIKNKDQH